MCLAKAEQKAKDANDQSLNNGMVTIRYDRCVCRFSLMLAAVHAGTSRQVGIAGICVITSNAFVF